VATAGDKKRWRDYDGCTVDRMIQEVMAMGDKSPKNKEKKKPKKDKKAAAAAKK
jgi:cyclophilin family peptidyl-prolyl cis-trans isomerase